MTIAMLIKGGAPIPGKMFGLLYIDESKPLKVPYVQKPSFMPGPNEPIHVEQKMAYSMMDENGGFGMGFVMADRIVLLTKVKI